MSEKKEKINRIIINSKTVISDALKKMDQENVKLLLILDDEKFTSVLSIGDIQRAIIKDIPLESVVGNILRKKIVVAHVDDDFSRIKEKMFKYRAECMPVLDDNNNLVDVYFWEDVFLEKEPIRQDKIKLPVVIMAGGKGTRLRPITNVIPKPLIPLSQKPIVQVIMDSFKKIGVNQFFLSVNYKYKMIEYYFNDISEDQYNIEYFKEDKPLGTAGSLYLIKDKIKNTFFVTNCDILIDQDYRDIYNFHIENNNDITIVGAIKQYQIPYGTLEIGKNSNLKALKEKPELTFFVNTGMYILEKGVLDYIPEGNFFHMTDLIEEVIDKGRKVGVFPVSERSWMDIGEWNEYQKTLVQFEKKFYRHSSKKTKFANRG